MVCVCVVVVVVGGGGAGEHRTTMFSSDELAFLERILI